MSLKSRVFGLLPVLAVAAAGCKTVRVETMFAASPATVWEVIADAPAYEQWNPVHIRVEGEYVEGSEVTVHLKDKTGEVHTFPAEVRRVVAERELNQGGGMPLLFTFDHTFELKEVDGQTLLTQQEKFRGVGVLFFDWVDDEAYTQVNLAAKERAEQMQK